MAKLLKLRRGTTTQHGSFTGAEGEVTVDTDKETLVVHDGSTAGGHPVAAEDMANVSSASIAGRLSNDSIAVSKIAAGTLPSDVKIQDANVSGNLTIESADIVDGTIVNADINASAAIGLSKLATGALPSGITVASANIVDGTITNGDVNTGAAIAGTKVSPDFGSQNIVTTGTLSTGTIGSSDISITGSQPKVDLIDSGDNPDFSIVNNNGQLRFLDTTNNVGRIVIQSDGTVDVAGNLDANGGLDVTGNLTVSGTVNSGAHTVTGNITVSGTVDGRDVAADGTKLDGIESGATADQTAAEIRTLVESASDSNVFTDADHTKLNGIETGATADQTGGEILSLINSSDIYTTGAIGRDNGDKIYWNDNSRLDVFINGSNEFRFEADGDFHADGDVYAFSTTTASDETLKKDITIVSDAVSKVEAIKGVTFKWKKSDADSAGVIAQDVEKVLPEVVKTVQDPDGNQYKAVNYSGITSILIEAIKDLSARIKVLEAK